MYREGRFKYKVTKYLSNMLNRGIYRWEWKDWYEVVWARRQGDLYLWAVFGDWFAKALIRKYGFTQDELVEICEAETIYKRRTEKKAKRNEEKANRWPVQMLWPWEFGNFKIPTHPSMYKGWMEPISQQEFEELVNSLKVQTTESPE